MIRRPSSLPCQYIFETTVYYGITCYEKNILQPTCEFTYLNKLRKNITMHRQRILSLKRFHFKNNMILLIRTILFH